jgi:starch synthase (maltosyl-transferring)
MAEAREHGAPPVHNESIICCGRTSENGDNAIATTVNLDPCHVQPGWVEPDLGALGINPHAPSQMHELPVDPRCAPAHIFRLRRRVRSVRDFDYFL